ncbi:MAG: hypothetical protein HC769_00665 [Cyanobacteria bacterium CRU_2_1]|nr:hypothetical protein [Cyanobacteria bacterium CRU_2_1]
MSESASTLNSHEIHEGLNRLGLNLSEPELNELKTGNAISLEGRSLGEIGSVFILAAALSAVNSGNPKKQITFQDLAQAIAESKDCYGLPLFYWNSSSQNKYCIYLTLVDGKPAIRTCHYYHSDPSA